MASEPSSTRYQDYVIRDGRLVGQFDAMYQHAQDVPWHQDRTAYSLVSDLDLTILRHFHERVSWKRVLDLGCGLGYMTARLKAALPGIKVHGADISETAVARARTLHQGITFETLDIRTDGRHGCAYDLIVVKDLLWYVLPELQAAMANLFSWLDKRGWVYVCQAVPGVPDFYGKDVFSSPSAILDYLAGLYEPRYASSTFEKTTARVVGVYEVDKYARFLGQVK